MFYPVVFGGKIFSNGDTTTYYYPLYNFYSNSLKIDNRIPLWVPSILSGFPGAISQIGYYSPLNILFFKFLGMFSAYGWLTLVNFFLAVLFSYILFKLFFGSAWVAIFSSLIYSFSQFNIGWGGSLNLSTSFWILPLIFLAVHQFSRNKNWWILFLIPGIIIGFLGVHPQFFVYGLFGGLLFALFFDFTKTESKLFGKNFFVTFKFAISVALGFLISYPFLVKFFDFAKFSARGGGLSYAASTVGSLNFADLVKYILPSLNTPISSQGILPYIGIIGLVFAVSAIFIRRKNSVLKFFIFLFIFCFITAVKYSPIFWLMHKLPVFKLFRNPSEWFLVGNFALTTMAGFAFGRLLEEHVFSKTAAKISAIAFGLIAAAILGFNIIVMFFEKNVILWLVKYAQKINFGGGTSGDAYGAAIIKYFSKFKLLLSFTSWEVLATLLISFLSLIAFYFYKNKKISSKNLIISVMIIAVANIFLIWHNTFRFIPREALSKEPDTAIFLNNQKQDGQFRIFRFYPGINEYLKSGLPEDNPMSSVILQKDTLASNHNVLFGIDSIGGYENFETSRMNDILSYLGYEITPTTSRVGSPRQDRISVGERAKIVFEPQRRGLFSMMNVKFIISSFSLDSYFPKVFSAKTVANIPVYIYENPSALNRTYLIDGNKVTFINSKNDMDVFEALLKIKDFRSNAVIECADCKIGNRKANLIKKLDIENLSPENYKFTVSADRDSFLIFSESNIIGWEASIDGKKANIYPANYIYQGVYVPSGSHQILFHYKGI
jgi:hypothetical protein